MTASPRAARTAVLAALAVLAAGCAAEPGLRARADAAPPVCGAPVVIGHRGAPQSAPENTMASFDTALQEGADWLETDVQTTRDGVPVLMHDATVDRTTDGKGAVGDLTAAQVAALRVTVGPGPAEPVPTLDQLLKRLAGSNATLLMEIKWQRRPEDVTRIAKLAAGSGAHVVLYSFSADHLRLAHAAAPALPVVLIQGAALADNPGDLPLRGIALDATLASASRIAAERKAGREVYVWTLDDEESWQLMTARDADGLITDTPGRARRWLDANCPTDRTAGPRGH
ncbi:glycerophosphodiester phosphodiesterase [Kitasatospora aureofaciens]|uniref:glycerophosphodiester phosphodiesterase n=1 Tax=Kitasatospora aureofaciens TaxID=1894 RepID=UPI001C447998|nr:glycerophosphodiester phosphodiesterase [Kitasatospora aureofaciens]MBV6697146.1 glycerophosphodiester phosphodiesterase [Kitasatospora aureofaciens]